MNVLWYAVLCFNIYFLSQKTKATKKSTEDDHKGQDTGAVVGGTSAESAVIADEVFKLFHLVLRRTMATFSHIRRQSLWGATGEAVIGQVRDSLTRVSIIILLHVVHCCVAVVCCARCVAQ